MAKKSFKNVGVSAFLSELPESLEAKQDAMPQNLIINPTFKALIPPLEEDEYTQLEANLLEYGIREPISIWNETIIDGHNRYELAQKHNLAYSVVSYNFENDSDVIFWIINNQFGRRNLNSWNRSLLALKLKPIIAERAHKNRATHTTDGYKKRPNANHDNDYQHCQISDKADTKKELAKIAGVSHDTINKVERIISTATPETIQRLEQNKISINKALQEIKSKEKPELPKHEIIHADTYAVIYADIPSLYKINELIKINIPAKENAVLFMWSAVASLENSLQILNKWGFKYETCIIWDKQAFVESKWTQGSHDILLIGVKGNYPLPTKELRFTHIHSEFSEPKNITVKPSYFYEQIEQMYPNEKLLELFSKKKFSALWNLWEK